jgi:hypothetical protein
VIVLASVVLARFTSGWFRSGDVFLSWIAASLGLLLVIPPFDGRYLFYTLPPLAIVIFAACDTVAARLKAPLALRATVLLAVATAAVLTWQSPVRQVTGFDEAARYAAIRSPRRLLILSKSYNGAFVFEFRARQTARRTLLLRGHGLPPDQFQGPDFLRLLHELGVEYVVLHDSSRPEPWESVRGIRDTRLIHEAGFRAAITGEPHGSIHIYRFTDPSDRPRRVFVAPSSIGAKTRTIVME